MRKAFKSRPRYVVAALFAAGSLTASLVLLPGNLLADNHRNIFKGVPSSVVANDGAGGDTAGSQNEIQNRSGAVRINLENAVGGLYASAPRPLWDLAAPLEGAVSSGFGPRGARHHDGTDILATKGSLVLAVQAGEVIRAGEISGYGIVVDIDHGEGVTSRYGHLSSFPITVGDIVSQGDVIGAVGSTGVSGGYHLHVEIHINRVPVDPYMYIPF